MFSTFLTRLALTSGMRSSGAMPAASPVRTRFAAMAKSIGLCSRSMMKKSRPALAITSTSIGLALKCIMPMTTSPRASFCLIALGRIVAPFMDSRREPQIAGGVAAGAPARKHDGRRAVLFDDRPGLRTPLPRAAVRARRRRPRALRRRRRACAAPSSASARRCAAPRTGGNAGLPVTPIDVVRRFTISISPSGSARP